MCFQRRQRFNNESQIFSEQKYKVQKGPYKSRQKQRTRQLESNMRLIVETVAKDRLQLRGSRIIPKQVRQNQNRNNVNRTRPN